MSIESILGIDNTDPESRHADRLVQSDMHLIEELVAFRKARNISQATVARHMGIDPSGVSKIEAGYRDLLQSTLQRYALAIGAVIEHRVLAFEDVEQTPRHTSAVLELSNGSLFKGARRKLFDEIAEILRVTSIKDL